MYLKSIEIQGFKSFANKTVFEFKEGITGIVGPNGSGKSNIADAVRWVLGEQKIKQLRGSKMEDVIFSGTEIRKPLGFAYVAITINNADRALNIEYEEVTVSRRLYRSGESEYMMNGTECRLKDIYELFYDTGIGKEGYSIIGQGQIDKIIGGRPEDRRELFDEAAGIVKFKKRKVETLRKLEQERDNLARVNDIMSELERRIRPLERQSETAKKYLELKDRLKTYDINSFLLEIGELNDTLLKIDEKSKIVTNDFEDRNKELEETKLKYEELDKLLEELDFSIENIRENYNNSVREKDRLEGDLRLLDEQINSAKAQDENIKGKIKEIEKNILENNAEQETYEKEKELIKAQLEQASKEGAAADSKVSAINERIAEIKAEIEEVKTKIIDNLNEKSNVNSRMSRFDAMIEQINIRKQTIAESLEKFESDTSEQRKIIEKIETELKAVNDEIVTLSEKNDNTQKRILELSALKKELFKKNDSLNDKFHSINSNINFLNNMTERYEGYGNSIKKVMELKETKKGIVGVVADIISSDKKYEVAIETALGGNIQNVVTDNENTAKEAIEYLKRGKFGRATFLPLSSIANKTGFTNERALMESGVIGLACDLVKIDKQYENIARFLLGRVLVVDTIDNALVIARKYNYTLRIVTLEGETLNPGGSLSGGAFKNQSNLLGRRRELNELKESLDEIKKEMALVEQSIAENDKESKNLKDLLDANKVTLSEKFILQNTLKMQHNQANSKNIEISENYQNFTKENSEIMEQIASIDTDRKEMLDRVNSCERVNSELEAQVDSLNVMLDKETEKQSVELKQNEELRLTLQSLNQKNDYAVANLNRIYADTKRLKEELENKMIDFINHQYDIMLCTTIIETGIDIPNVNTLIILNADYFGLSQLYQVRGRVGRSNKIAYAYLMYDKNKMLNDIAIKRLNVIKEFTELGSGFSIATRDLSIRGAGDILGSEQAGFIDNIGIDLYLKILNEEVAKLKGESVEEEQQKDEKPLLNVETHISDEYVEDTDLKIEIHKKINEIDSYDKLLAIKKEIEDRFGKIDEKVITYMYEEWFESLAKKYEVEEVHQTKNYVELVFSIEMSNKIDGEQLFLEAFNISRMFRFQMKSKHLILILDTIKLEENYVLLLTKLLDKITLKKENNDK